MLEHSQIRPPYYARVSSSIVPILYILVIPSNEYCNTCPTKQGNTVLFCLKNNYHRFAY